MIRKAKILKYNSLLLLVLLLLSCNDAKEPTSNNNPINNKINFDAENPYLSIDKSPMDMIYYPPNFPMQKMDENVNENKLVARVIYSRPQKGGREIFADSSSNTNYIQAYGKEWRLGANEATEIEFFKPVTIQGNKINPGKYVLYCIPFSDKWVIKINNNLYSWGLHMNPEKDFLQFNVPVQKKNNNIEYFTMVFKEATYGTDLLIAWGNIEVLLPISFEQ